ncbi:MAG: N-acetylglucosaminyldiphosphoundecaprenol N-acetyl-beta-D-mannosaminyltransferase [Actinomycetota bacterium]|nr:N-acetylglucosaminyldiphosphoundecaprenol N-acetyl-beta-D-mannosaminyltransferase [Actinomycetota bacterium]
MVVDRALGEDPGAYVCLTNVHTTVESQGSAALRAAAANAFLSVPDGMPLVWILRRRGHPTTEKVTGIEFAPMVAEAGLDQEVRHFFFGGADGVAEKAAAGLTRMVPGTKVVGTITPPFSDRGDWSIEELQAEVERTRAQVLWVGLGAPRQEIWMSQVAGRLNVPVMVGVGAAFDFLAGTKKAAPKILRHVGLEWAFRLLSEPRRLWRRYLGGNAYFVYLLARSAMARNPPAR